MNMKRNKNSCLNKGWNCKKGISTSFQVIDRRKASTRANVVSFAQQKYFNPNRLLIVMLYLN